MITLLLPYNSASGSAKALAKELGIKRANLDKTTPNRYERTIINWGNSGENLGSGVLDNAVRILNPPSKVTVAIDKLKALECLSRASVNIPEFTSDREVARGWLEKGKEVVSRALTRASSGRGISFVGDIDQLFNVPLYTQYVKKKDEYRVHVIGGIVADVQRKAKREGASPSAHGWKLRNVDNGFVYVRGGVSPPSCVLDQALLAMDALELDFGAVDIIYNQHQDKAYVLEVNTACGLEGTTLQVYSDGIRALLEDSPVKQWEEDRFEEEDTLSDPIDNVMSSAWVNVSAEEIMRLRERVQRREEARILEREQGASRGGDFFREWPSIIDAARVEAERDAE